MKIQAHQDQNKTSSNILLIWRNCIHTHTHARAKTVKKKSSNGGSFISLDGILEEPIGSAAGMTSRSQRQTAS